MSKPWESPGFSRGGAVNDYIGNPENWQQLGERYDGNAAYKDSWDDIGGYAKLVADKIVCDQ